MKKCAWIRSDRETSEKHCPFGLPITESCRSAGSSVTHMCPLEAVPKEEIEKVAKANKRVYIYHKEGVRCLYAANIIEDAKAVNCDFGDVGQGRHLPGAIEGSPLYAQTFGGIGLDGLYAFPLGFYADNNESRNLFQGLFSLVGSSNDEIVKYALLNNGCSESIMKKINEGERLSGEEALALEDAIDKCRKEFEQGKTDATKAKELADKYNPRKRL